MKKIPGGGKLQKYKNELAAIFNAAITRVAPDTAIKSHLKYDRTTDTLKVGGRIWNIAGRRLYVLGAGKGTAPMAAAVEELLGPRIDNGLVVVKSGHDLPLSRLENVSASHPVPDASGMAAARRMLDLAAELGPQDMLICLISGGASALTTLPAPGATLDDLQKTTAALLACGATIAEINALRKHLTLFGGGRLAAAANGAQILSLIVSDVIGDDLAVIASGPTAPDPSTFLDCLKIVDKYGLHKKLPASVMAILEAGVRGDMAETPKANDPVFKNVCNLLVATNMQALEAAAAKAAQLGLKVSILCNPVCGEAAQAAAELIDRALELQAGLESGKKICLLAGGETTVTLPANAPAGGRNQEMAISGALALAGRPGIYALFASTDGNDGPTDAAGGFAFPDSLGKLGGKAAISEILDEHNAYAALTKSGDIFRTGPTLTNVMDLAIIIVEAL